MSGFYYFAKAGVLSFEQIADFSSKNVTILTISSAKENIFLMELKNLYKQFEFFSTVKFFIFGHPKPGSESESVLGLGSDFTKEPGSGSGCGVNEYGSATPQHV